MSVFFTRSAPLSTYLEGRGVGRRGSMAANRVSAEQALRSSAVWACLRLRADLISTTPIDVFRKVGGVQVEVDKPPLLVNPSGKRVSILEWLYSSQFDLDRYGNAFGIISEKDGQGFPRRVDLISPDDVSVVVKGGELDHYKVGNQRYEVDEIWHERQFTVSGLHVGLSPIAYAAWSIGTYLSAQEFAYDWFSSGAAPTGHLRNTAVQTVDASDAEKIKGRFKSSVENRDIFVTGRDWEYTFQQVPANTVMFLDEMKYGVADVCRFLGVPGDMIDAESSTGSVTYANVGQRNLQLLVINLGPSYTRREAALSAAMPAPRFAKFNTDALMRMDPKGRSEKLIAEVAGRLTAPSEARGLENRAPFTDSQLAEFDRLFGAPRPPSTNGAPA